MPGLDLNFQRADYTADVPMLQHCDWCGRGVTSFFRAFDNIGEVRLCAVCAERLKSQLPVLGAKTYWRTAATGAATAAAGSAIMLFTAHLLLTHRFGRGAGLALGLLSIGLGIGIGRAMHWAARGAGGRKYQITAAFLAYWAAAVAFSGAFIGFDGAPLWAIPLFGFGPLFMLFAPDRQFAVLTLLLASYAMVRAWRWLPPAAVKVVGPVPVGVPAGAEAETTSCQ